MSLLPATLSPFSEVELGYRFDPACPPDQPAHQQLIVWLRTTPTERHYDPETVECVITTATDTIELLTIQHPWPLASTYQVAPGRIVLTDRKHKSIEAFTFGCNLQIDALPAVTICTFHSPAPILPLVAQESVTGRLATEVEVILAEQRAKWAGDHSTDAFALQLALLSPFDLYLACLVAVEQHLLTLPATDTLTHDTLRFIDHEREKLLAAGRWPETTPPLAELL